METSIVGAVAVPPGAGGDAMPVVIITVQNPSGELMVTTPPILVLIAFIPPPSWITKVGIANAEAAHVVTAKVANTDLMFFTINSLAYHIPIRESPPL